MRRLPLVLALTLGAGTAVSAADEADAPANAGVLGLEEVLQLDANEPFAESYEPERAREVLGLAAKAWTSRKGCVTCHTNGAFLMAGTWGPPAADHAETLEFARGYLRDYVEAGRAPSGRRGQIEGVVATTAFTVIAEARAGPLSPITRDALKHALSLQDKDGAWKAWLSCGWPPFEVDAHYGASLMAVAAGLSRKDRAWKNSTTRNGLAKLRRWLREHPPEGGHQEAMMLWASEELTGLASSSLRKKWRRSLCSLQREDGGWSVHDLRHTGWPDAPDEAGSDPYGTAFIAFVLQASGDEAGDEHVARALSWLRQHQRASGRWYLPSPRKPGQNDYLSFAATAFAWMALSEADAD